LKNLNASFMSLITVARTYGAIQQQESASVFFDQIPVRLTARTGSYAMTAVPFDVTARA
jgi:hypothetical protein